MLNLPLILLNILVILEVNKCYCKDELNVEPREQSGTLEERKQKAKTDFANLKSQCYDSEDNVIPCLMNAYLKAYKLVPEKFCKPDDQNCLTMVQSFDQRCSQNAEECLILDSVDLVELEDGHVYVPDLVQVEISNFVFKKSGAYKSCEWPRSTCVGECSWHCDCKSVELVYKRDFKAFVKLLTDKNAERLGLTGGSDLETLNIFLYRLLLYYTERYLYKDDGSNFFTNRNLQPTLRYSRSKNHRKLFSKMRRNEDIKIHVSYKDLEKLFNGLGDFLAHNPIRKHEPMALSFAKIIRYTITKSVPYYKHSYLFVDVLKHAMGKKFGASSCCSKNFYETFCDKYSPDGQKLFEGFVNRCLDGNCYVFDDYTLFKRDNDQDENAEQETDVDAEQETDVDAEQETDVDAQQETAAAAAAVADPDDIEEVSSSDSVGIKAGHEKVVSNYILPNLSEVNLVFYLLKHTNFKYGKFSSFFTNRTRPRAEIKYMTPRLMYVNKIKFQVPNETHEIIQTFLYYSAIYFVKTYREYWITRGVRHFANWDVKPKLTQYLLGIGRGRQLIIEQEEIEKIFPHFKEYLLNSYYRNHPRRVNNFVGKMEEVLMSYYNEPLGNISCCSKPCIECQ